MERNRMRSLCLFALLASTASATDFIGMTYPPFRDGMQSTVGGCVAGSRGPEHECDYSVGTLESSEGKPIVLIGSRLVGHDEQQKAIWKVTSSVAYPDVPDGYSLAIASCQVNGEDDQTIVAVVRNEEAEWLGRFLWIRRFDLDKEVFVEQPAEGVQCRNEAAGL
ncbi:hypothetical protein ACFPN2_15570 [Steroidobacter flavus]|uniref:DUF3757 domain-containing protein n=1 Tax=Steroidobacter flavus TaxID=1842136 RepID=A0ABV8ST19_9GAMM